MYIYWLSLIYFLNIAYQKEQLYENFNSRSISSAIDWNCNSPSQGNSQIYSCTKGSDVIKIDFECYEIEAIINVNMPHFEVYNQFLKDIYAFGSIDQNEPTKIIIDDIYQSQYYQQPYQNCPFGYTVQCSYIHNQNWNCQMGETFIIKKDHTSNQIKIKLHSTLSPIYDDEAYLLRNVQIFYNRCYKTCKTCKNQEKDGCIDCYNGIVVNSNICDSCINKINQKFLKIPDGCLQECPIGYSYDEDYICYENNRLMQIGITLIIQTYMQTIQFNRIQLRQSAISLRMIVTINFSSYATNQNIQIIFNQKQILNLRFNYIIYIDPDTKVVVIFSGTQNTRIELNSKIDSKFITWFITLNLRLYGTIYIVFKKSNYQNTIRNFKLTIEQELCVQFCEICKSNNKCQICDFNKKLYNGLCIDKCPESAYELQNVCFELDGKLDDSENLFLKILVQEFFDISTTKERIDDLFTIEDGQSNQLNFQKGQGIYFAYIPDKRIFGGPFVWVNAKFKFHFRLPEQEQALKLSFEVFLGNNQIQYNSLHFTINNNNKQTLILQTNQNVLEDHSWDDNYITQKFVVTQLIYYQSSMQNELNIQFHCEGHDQQSFCGIQNFKILSIQCEIGFLFDQYNYYQKQNPCIPICGDNLVLGNEQCDDGNLEPFDGCYLCMFQCEENCKFCVKGECLLIFIISEFDSIYFIPSQIQDNICELSCQICINNMCIQCQNGYYINLITNQCETICGDSIIRGNEQCDDDNYDGCSYCQSIKFNKCDHNVENSLQKCAVCHLGICIKCNQGYFQEDDNCYSYCGDGLVNEQTEECDNYNQIGCENCKAADGYICVKLGLSPCLTCDIKCTNCQRIQQDKLQCMNCFDGYYPSNDECLICDPYCITCKDQPNLQYFLLQK